MYDCKAPLSRFYYPDTRRIINAFIIIFIIIHILCIIKLCEDLIAEESLTIVTARRRRNSSSNRANFDTIKSIEHARWDHLRSLRLIDTASLKVSLHDTIRSCGALRLPCTWVHRIV